MRTRAVSPQTAAPAARLYYLDALRVIATLGVFLFHASNIFNGTDFEITNAESSEAILIIDTFFYPWGMPLFFLVAGAGSFFALRRRSAGQFTRERVQRLLVPFLIGSLLLGPVQLYLSWRHRTETGAWAGSWLGFAMERLAYPFPKLIGALGYHLWFLGFLFVFSLLALPVFLWLKGESGQKFTARLAGLCERRGAILLFILPLAGVRLALQPFFPELQNWADFFFYGLFYILGYLLFTDERFTQAIRRDWGILLGAGIAAFAVGLAIGLSLESFGIENPPHTLWEFVMWAAIAACGWCWAVCMLFMGMRYLDHDSPALRYGQVTLLPFFVLHQPALLAMAYFVVQWEADLLVKLLVIVVGAFAISLGLTEWLIKRVGLLRALFGMKAERPVTPLVAPG